jgi:hypothetical protein
MDENFVSVLEESHLQWRELERGHPSTSLRYAQGERELLLPHSSLPVRVERRPQGGVEA